VNSELEKLVELQKTDNNIRRLKKSVETADERRANIEQEFEQHASSIREIQNKRDAAKAERAEFDKQIAEQQVYLERANRNLKTSQDQKQYETALRETDTLQKQISALETKVLEKMTEIEELEKVLAERADEINSLEGNHAQALAAFDAELARNDKELAAEIKKREGVFSTIPKNWSSVYNRLIQRSHDGIAVAEVKNGACSACFMSLRKQLQQQLNTKDEIMICENCARILYVVKSDAKAAKQDS
jgi:predicted  nucleic acid-binding Zn-ribbon protein